MNALEPWGQSDLPQPPAYSLPNAIRIIGPGAILLAVSLGSGDWLLGPTVTVRYGPALLWICAASVILQAFLNTEMARYTLATGEPIFSGFMRTRPGAAFWGWSYAVLHALQLGWPGWALAAGTTMAAAFLGRVPRDEDGPVVLFLGYAVFLGSVAMAFGARRTRATIERIEPVVLGGIWTFLLVLGLLFVPWSVWLRVAGGFVSPLIGGGWTAAADWRDLDWALLAAFAAYSGAGGTINATLTHWLRDKGFGMAGTIRSVSAMVGGENLYLSGEGRIFPVTEANLAKWRQWWRYLQLNLGTLWTAGCLISMSLPALIALHFVAPRSESGGSTVATFLAAALSERHGFALWLLTLAAGFWILASNQAGIVEGFGRSVTDILWTCHPRLRAAGGGAVRWVHAGVLGLLGLGGSAAMALGDPLRLIVIGANVAALNMVILSVHTLWVNRTLLPSALRPPRWKETVLLAGALFFLSLVSLALSRPARLLTPAGP